VADEAPPRPARSRTIPADLHAATLARLRELNPDTARPFTCAEVAKWLDATHKCPASRLAVQRLRATTEAHTAAQVTAALREEVAESVRPMLARLNRVSRRLEERARTETNVQKLAAATSALARAHHELATVGGVAAPTQIDLTSGGQPLPDIHDRLLASLAKLAAEPEPGGAGAVGPKPPEGGG